MVEINGKVYRNLQEQVEKNKEDIEELQQGIVVDAYTKAESDARFQGKLTAGNNITIDENNVISAAGGSGGDYVAGTGIDITNNTISVDSNTVPMLGLNNRFSGTNSFENISTKVFSATNANIIKYFEDDFNPEEFAIKTPVSYNDALNLFATQDDNSHPCDAGVYVYPDKVIIESNDYNHGDNDDTYEGEIAVYDTSINLSVDTGDDEMHLRITDSDISYSTDGTTYTTLIPTPVSGSHLFRHNIGLSGTTSSNQGYIVYFDIYNNDSTTYTSLADVLNALNDGSTGFTGDRITCNGLIATNASTQYRPVFIRKDTNDSSWLDAVYFYYSNSTVTFGYIAIASSQTGFSLTDTIAKIY